MGRRALRKIDPSLDLSRHLLPLEDLSQPLDLASLCGRQAPIEIEVGSGKGLFLETATADHPERDFVGVELIRKYARYSAARLARWERSNGVVIQGDAKRLFREYLGESAACAVHVYFPDPWWKKRHHKRRLMDADFVADVERVLVPGGVLHFWTDVEAYYHETLEVLAKQTRLEGPIAVQVHDPEHDLDYRTHFERRMRLHDLPVYRGEFRRPSAELHDPSSAATEG
jgi:tRNA (guanine-N7-)-methyltransferase